MGFKQIILICISLCLHEVANCQVEQSLNGQWEIIFDENNRGRDLHWYKDSTFQKNTEKRSINVPSSWELIKKDYEGVCFYRHEFEIAKEWKGKVVRINFGAVNYLSEFWLNDQVVGFHEGGFTPFEFRVDKLLKYGETNVLTARVVGPVLLSDKKIDGIGPLETPQWRGGISGGIWQEVKLIATDEVYIEDTFIEPDLKNEEATFHLILDHSGIKATEVNLEIDISTKSDSLAT
ncbi:MAG: sugar-binding domain-containing protein, partial [Bacteroidota bacterium]